VSSGRGRGQTSGASPARWIALGVAAVVVLGVTFTAGVQVGRQWSRQAMHAPAPEGEKKTAAARKSGLVEGDAAAAKPAPEKLTFYQTLTAPLGPAPSYAKPGQAGKAAPPQPAAAPTAAAQPAPPPPAAAATPGSSWSVQVGVFKTRQQADTVQRDLRASGFEAYVTPAAAEGETRYRVRVGTFAVKSDAQRVADRVRAERSLPTYVTSN
jgi:cell division protein FtsN